MTSNKAACTTWYVAGAPQTTTYKFQEVLSTTRTLQELLHHQNEG